MIPDDNHQRQTEQPQPEPHPEKRKPSRLLVVLAALDYLLYWVLVFYFPRIMIAATLPLVIFVLYLRKTPGLVFECLQNLNLTPPAAEWILRWLSAWVVTVLLGCAFAIILVS